MICQVNIMPDYINALDVSPATKQQARNVHVSVVNELMNLTNKDGYKVFVNDQVVDFSVIALNPFIDRTEALAIANNKISELNKTYNNPVRFLETLGKLYIAVNTTSLANQLESVRDQYTDEYLKDSGKFFNLEAHVDQKIDDSIMNNCIEFLTKLGINVQEVDTIEHGISAKGLADLLQKTVKYVYGYQSVLPEEAAHFLTNLMPKNHPVMVEAMNKIVNYPIYQEVVEAYGERYDYNEDKLKHEAIGKLIAQRIKNAKTRVENMQEKAEPVSWMKSMLNWFKSLFAQKQNDDAFDILADRIIKGDISDLSFENIENEVIADGIFLNQTKYEEMMKKYDSMSENKQKKVTKQIRSMFSNINALKKSINEMEVNLEAASKTMFDKTLQFLKTAVKNVENTSLSSVNTFIEMAIQTELMLQDFYNETEVITDISDPNLKLFKLYQFNRSTDLLTKSIVPQLAEVYRYLSPKDGPMHSTIGNILTLSNFIEGFINTEYLETLSEVYPEMLRERTQELTDKINQEIEPLQKQLDAAIARGDKKNEAYLKDKINKKTKQIKYLGNQDRVKDILTGLAGDSSGMSFWVEGASMSGDIIINELDDFIKTCILSNYQQYQTLSKQVSDKVNAFQKATGRSQNNPDQFYENIIEEATIVTGIDENGNPITYNRKKFTDEYDASYIYEMTLREARIEHIRKQELAETDGAKREALNKEKQALITELNKFTRENFELETTDEYNEVSALLDVDLGDGMTAREATKDIYQRMRMKQNEIRRTSSVDRLESLYSDYLALIRELKDLRSEYNKTGVSLKVAKQLKLYAKKMREMVDYELTDESIADHNKHLLELKRELDNGEITQDEYEYKVEKSYEVRPTKAYVAVREDLIERIRVISERQADQILDKNSILKENISELYKQMEDAVGKLRDEYGEVEIEDVTDPETIKLIKFIKETETKIQEYKKQLVKVTGFTQEDIELKKALIKEFKTADFETRQQISAALEEINKRANKSSLDASSRDELTELMGLLDELTSTENSSYYNEKLDEQIQMLMSSVENYDKTKNYTDDDGITYSYNEDLSIWISSTGEEKSDVAVNAEYKYRIASEDVKNTEWYKDNHYERKRFSREGVYYEDVPIYVWRVTKPADESYLEKVPAFRFRERVIKSKYRNANAETLDGKPRPKKDGKFKSNKKLTDTEKGFRDFLTSVHENFQKKIPLGKRIGNFLPSIPKGGFEKAVTTNPAKIGKAFKSVWDWAVRAVKGNEQDQDYLSGKVYDNFLGDIPLLFTGRIDAEQQTSDAAYAVLHFAGHIIKYDALKKAMPLAAGTAKVLSNPENRPIRPEKVKILERAADPAAFALTLNAEDRIKNESIRQKHVNSIINRAFFGQHQYAEEVGGVNIGKIANEGMQIAAYQILGGKIMANIKNNIAGKIQMFLASQFLKNKIYSEKNLAYGQMKSFEVLMEIVNDRYKGGDLGYYNQLLNMVNAFQGEFYNEFGQKVSMTLLKDAVNIRNLFMTPKNAAEIEMQIVNAMAVLDSIYIEHEGKKIPLHEVFELKDSVIAAKDGMDPKQVDKAVKEATRKLAYVNIVTNGNFDRMNAVEAEKYSLGRLLLFLNKYFVPMFMFRYADTKYNASINEITTGYHRDFFLTIVNDFRSGYVPLFRMVTNPDQYTTEEKNAALTVAYEFGILFLLAMGYSLLGGKEPDKYQKLKEDPNGYWKAQVLNMILSIKLETETVHPFYGIDNIAQKIKSPFPVARLYENIVKFAYTLNFGDEDFYKRDTGMYSKGQAKAYAYMLKLSGLEGILLEVTNPIERLKRTEQSQFIKQ